MEDLESKKNNRFSYTLKAAIFATGISGIVAEYLLATMATYFLGDSIFQWTIIVSIMLFSMGVGSSISRKINKNLLFTFLLLEMVLSILASFSTILVYISAGYFKVYVSFYIYSLSIILGLLIGMEIPLVARINESFEELKHNISSVMALDYVGSLLGGVFFVFVGLPYLGLTYTPFIVGAINFAVALFLIPLLKDSIQIRRIIYLAIGVFILLMIGIFSSEKIRLHSEEARYKEKIIFQKQSRYQNVVITQKKDIFWLFLNGNQQLSTFDEHIYHEAIVHPIMKLTSQPQNILILGGGDGCAVREVLKYPSVERITLVDLDSVVTNLAQHHWVLAELNENSLSNKKVTIINTDAFSWLENQSNKYDVIIIDLPDPKSIDLARMYSKEFYWVCKNHLTPHGALITQAGSPMFAPKAFECINLTMKNAGLKTIKLHNHILTLGEWGYIIGVNRPQEIDSKIKLSFDDVKTKWLNTDAFLGMQTFGKLPFSILEIQENTIASPKLQEYYLKGSWNLYN